MKTETIEVHGLGDMLKQTSEQFPQGFGQWTMLYKHGHAGKLEPFTAEEQAYLKKLVGRKKWKRGFCYMNAQKLFTWAQWVEEEPNLKYVEGLVTVHGIPIGHAWLEYNGKVFDPTLLTIDGKKKDTGEEAGEYWGVPVSKTLLRKSQLQTRRYSPVIENPDLYEQVYKEAAQWT